MIDLWSICSISATTSGEQVKNQITHGLVRRIIRAAQEGTNLKVRCSPSLTLPTVPSPTLQMLTPVTGHRLPPRSPWIRGRHQIGGFTESHHGAAVWYYGSRWE
jgi:hypothetical protein